MSAPFSRSSFPIHAFSLSRSSVPCGRGGRPRETPTVIASTGIQACEAVAVVSRVAQNQNHRRPASEPRARLRAFLDKQAARKSARGPTERVMPTDEIAEWWW
jgi:hypothetical protein